MENQVDETNQYFLNSTMEISTLQVALPTKIIDIKDINSVAVHEVDSENICELPKLKVDMTSSLEEHNSNVASSPTEKIRTIQKDIQDDSIFHKLDASVEKRQRKLQQYQNYSKATSLTGTIENKFRAPMLSDLLYSTESSDETLEIIARSESPTDFPVIDNDSLIDPNRLVSKHIEIYWDGDRLYFPCTVIKCLSSSPLDPMQCPIAEFIVIYENDDTFEEYTEQLSMSLLARRQSPRFSSSSSSVPYAIMPITTTASTWRIWDGDNEEEYVKYMKQLKRRGVQVYPFDLGIGVKRSLTVVICCFRAKGFRTS